MGYCHDNELFLQRRISRLIDYGLFLPILQTANYGTDTVNGAYSVSNDIIWVNLCQLPFVNGDILPKQ